MKRLLLFLWLPIVCIASSFEEEDPMHFYYVNVITGHLDLTFQDAQIKAPFPYEITRSYTSSGALERSPQNSDLFLKKLRRSKWLFQGGWSFLPHTNMLEVNREDRTCRFYLSEPGGSHFREYNRYAYKKRHTYYRPKGKNKKTSGNLSRRKNTIHTRLKVRKDKATLRLPDGGKRYYIDPSYNPYSQEMPEKFWHLTLEILPSKHRIEYHYEGSQLSEIQLKNPAGTKTFSTIAFDRSSYKEERKLQLKIGDGQLIQYQMAPKHGKRLYLGSVQSSIRPLEEFHYQPGRKGIGARMGAFALNSNIQMGVCYHFPKTKANERNWAKKSPSHTKRYDKVESIQFPDPHTGEMTTFATFTYHKTCTEVWDYEGLLTRYHHDGERLLKIDYCDQDLTLRSSVEFTWKEDHLAHKTLLDENGAQIFRKTFIYNQEGDVIVEKLGNTFNRQFTYTDKHLIKEEKNLNGLKHHYEYYLDTDLVSKKITSLQGKIFKREFFIYDEDHLLKQTIVDDGTSWEDPFDRNGATHAQIRTYTRHPETGLIETETLAFLDDSPAIKRTYRYNEKRECIEETVSHGELTYSLYREYDNYGRLTKKTTPLGREHCYQYNSQGNLLYEKEVGQAEKRYEYDELNRPIRCIQNGKVTESLYDRKGRLLKQIDPFGNAIEQTYDSFGHLEETHLPKALDENGQVYTPVIRTLADRMGNIAATTNPNGHTTTTCYNLLRKPIQECYPDGSVLTHQYNLDGSLIKTIESDGTKICYGYDPFQRMITKQVFDQEELLSEEQWVYSTFHLLSYTNPLGLTTHYTYDPQGRKICETSGSRSTTYTYDLMGNVERITQGGITKVQLHNLEKEVVETWEEDTQGKVENRMRFVYDEEGRKTRAIRTTEVGEVEDHFAYDDEGRLCTHIDPYGAKTTFLYSMVKNELGQTTLQQTTTDPLGNQQIETYDAHGRIVSIENADPLDQLVSREEYLYDRAGNKARRIATIFEHSIPVRKHTTTWEYDERGRPIAETEEGEKRTEYTYNSRGWLIKKAHPSGIILTYEYDKLGRLQTLKSSDATVHYSYSYDRGELPLEAKDHLQNLTWKRTYNLFGELTSETTPKGATSYWEYDTCGRCILHLLPDQSSIVSTYDDLHLKTLQRRSSSGNILYEHAYTRFDANGHVTEETLIHHHGKTVTLHDRLERPTTLLSPWHRATIDYGPSGLVEQINNSLFQIKKYQYDPLNQLTKEGAQFHQFDSLGNPLDANINHFNQITSNRQCFVRYDPNGNPIRKQTTPDTITYEYDALNRLTAYQRGTTHRLQFLYDPFSRLYGKVTYTNNPSLERWDRRVEYYLYDKDLEIGLLDEQNTLQELKVLGLGIQGDIGAAVAIELQSEVFAPLHDFQGNIIALATPSGTLIDQCDMDAFGKAALIPTKNPWRFQSKRTEEGLIFFGLRFYDPDLGRWLTPDPAGSVESPNLYLYVRNSPLRRLDLFGLFSDDYKDFTTRIVTYHFDTTNPYMHLQSQLDEIQIDWLFFSTSIHKLGFSPEELPSGNIEIKNVFSTCLSKDSNGIGLYSLQTGVGVKLEDFEKDIHTLVNEVPGDSIKIFIHTPTKSPLQDALETMQQEKKGVETEAVAITRQLLIRFAESLASVSPNLFWMHVHHSRAGVIANRVIEGMTEEEKRLFRKHLLCVGLAPAEPLPKMFAKEAVNYYSDFDNITGDFGRSFERAQKKAGLDMYDIRFVNCITPIRQRTFYLTDHYLMAPTYTEVRKASIDNYEGIYGFYRKNR